MLIRASAVRRFCLWLLCIVVIVGHASAQFSFPPIGGRAAGMGGAALSLDDCSSATYNVAGLARQNAWTINLDVQQNVRLKELSHQSIALIAPFNKASSFAAQWRQYGSELYREQQWSLFYALKIGEMFALGTAFHYCHSSTDDDFYENLNAMTFTVAAHFYVSSRLTVAFRAANPAIWRVNDNSESPLPPPVFTLGMSYKAAESMILALDIEKNIYLKERLRMGAEYIVLKSLLLRMGMATNPYEATFGVGWRRNHVAIDAAVCYEQLKGVVPTVGLAITL